MSLTVQHLNDDATFLLTFAPSTARVDSTLDSYRILIDPWLVGTSSTLHPVFQRSRHTVEPAIKSLSELESVDLIIITQDKPDHCHKATLCSLPRHTTTRILATPAAAKTIRKWQHFEPPDIVEVVKPYHNKAESVVRIPVGLEAPSIARGEITIANIAPKLDIVGLHNAFGLTYRAPRSRSRANGPVSFNHNKPLPALPACGRLPPEGGTQRAPNRARQANGNDVLSVLYTPHGVSPSEVTPWLQAHLRPLNSGGPLTALFHCLTMETQPRMLGGRVNNGAPGGVKLLKTIKTKHWIGIHDEEKENSGVAVAFLKTQRFGLGDVYSLLDSAGFNDDDRPEVHVLACGEVKQLEP